MDFFGGFYQKNKLLKSDFDWFGLPKPHCNDKYNAVNWRLLRATKTPKVLTKPNELLVRSRTSTTKMSIELVFR